MSESSDFPAKFSRPRQEPSSKARRGVGPTFSTVKKTSKASSRPRSRYRLGGYVRLSPSDEVRDEGSLVSHPQRIQSFIDFKNVQQPGWGEITEWYVDKDFSGKDTKRPAFQRLLQDVKAGRINAVIVTELSRLSRDVKDFCQFWEFLKKYQATFLSLKENFDTSTPIGEMMVIQCISFAQFERKTIVQRIKDGARARAERGLTNGGQRVLGYDPHPTKRCHLVTNDAEASLVRHIFEKFVELGSIPKTRAYLNAAGYRTKAFVTKDGKPRGGGLWTEATLHMLLTNLKYTGKGQVNRQNRDVLEDDLQEGERYKIVAGSWTGIVEDGIFRNVQEMLFHNRRFSKVHQHVYRLSGLLQCGLCGEELVGVSANGRGGKYFYYGHKRKVTVTMDRHGKRCALERIQAVRIEEAVVSRLTELAGNQALVSQIAAEALASSNTLGRDLDQLIASKEQARRNLERLIDNLTTTLAEAPEGLSPKSLLEKISDYERQGGQIETALAELRQERRGGRAKIVDLEQVFQLLRAFGRGFGSRPAHEQREVLRDIVRRVTVYEDTVRLQYYASKQDEQVDLAAEIAASGHEETSNRALASRRSEVRPALGMVEYRRGILNLCAPRPI